MTVLVVRVVPSPSWGRKCSVECLKPSRHLKGFGCRVTHRARLLESHCHQSFWLGQDPAGQPRSCPAERPPHPIAPPAHRWTRWGRRRLEHIQSGFLGQGLGSVGCLRIPMSRSWGLDLFETTSTINHTQWETVLLVISYRMTLRWLCWNLQVCIIRAVWETIR